MHLAVPCGAGEISLHGPSYKPGGAGRSISLPQVDTSAFRATRETVTMDFAENDLQIDP